MRKCQASVINKLRYLLLAKEENTSNSDLTNIIRTACQYSSNPKLKPEDFSDILQMKLTDILVPTYTLEQKEKCVGFYSESNKDCDHYNNGRCKFFNSICTPEY